VHPSIDEWDAACLQSIATPDETADLEKKGSALLDPLHNKSATKEELAKQICAFANASAGFLVYGVASNGGLDSGALDTVRTESIKAWLEKVIPEITNPPVNNCQARILRVPGHHAQGRCAVVISIPLSDHRPH
jgi:predicted HTH transcriptional regulator